MSRRFLSGRTRTSTVVLATVLVIGALALVSCGQQPSQPGSFGVGTPTTTASSSLPMTVTASGISVTVNMVDSTSSATRFYVDIALPAYAVNQPADFILGQSPTDDVQINGLSASANDLHVSEEDATYSNRTLWLDYPSPFPTNGTVTLTFKQLWLPAKPTRATPTPSDYAKFTPVPVVMQTIEGPWVFHITPTMLASQPLPTPMTCTTFGEAVPPDIGCYNAMSVTMAQKLVSFPIIEPMPLPSSLIRDDFGVSLLRRGASAANRPNDVRLSYSPKSGQLGVSLEETTDRAAVPNVTDETESSVTPVAPNGPAQTQGILPDTLKTMNIDGVSVTRFEDGDVHAPVLHFVWTQDGVSYHISNIYTYLIVTATPPYISDADLLPMVTSIIEQSTARNPATPITSP